MTTTTRYRFTLASLLLVALATFALDAHAQDSAGLLDDVAERYRNAAAGWAGVIVDAASWVFWTLAVISLVMTFGFMALRRAELSEFFAEFVKFTMTLGFFWWLLVNGPDFAQRIMNSLRQVAGKAAGLGVGGLSPSGIVDVGYLVFAKVVDQTTWWKPWDSLIGQVLGIAVLVCLLIVGINMLLLLISGWVLAFGGVIFLGFGGGRWTSEMAINYYRTVLHLGVQLMMMVLLVGIGKTLVDDYYAQVNQGLVTLKGLGVMIGVSITMVVLVSKLPGFIASIATGGPVGGGGIGTSGAGMIMGAAGMLAAAGGMAAAMAVAGAAQAAGGAQALMAAFKAAGEGGGGSSGGSGDSSGGGGIPGLEWEGGSGSSGGSDASGGEGGGGTSSPFSEAAGFSGNGSEDSDTRSSLTAESGGGEQQAQGGSTAGATSASAAGAAAGGRGAGGASGGNKPSFGQRMDAVSNQLARGAAQVAREKARGVVANFAQRVADTPGARIASAIRGESPATRGAGAAGFASTPTVGPSFDGDNLAGDANATVFDADAEVAAFAEGADQPEPPEVEPGTVDGEDMFDSDNKA
ncbi:P-type conjugative transfer protein TrbL [Azohydromonas lata]|uniref:P-type conjugative transfer protein TrbL n=1 Tax=Azohydromonas lata TaxID=45677 RepID=UPI000A066EE2|nr:P-type conjugative transfer protein TrbL [Azohydromonas lata]